MLTLCDSVCYVENDGSNSKHLSAQMEERKKKQSVRTDHWLQPNIVVKVVTKRLGEKYHKKKAVVMVTILARTGVRCTDGAHSDG